MLWIVPALAADLRVPDDYATLDMALAQAADGDSISFRAGHYTFPAAPEYDVAVELRGRTDPTEVVIEGRILLHAELTLTSLTVAATDEAFSIDVPSLVTTHVRIVGETTQITPLRIAGRWTGSDVSLLGLTTPGPVAIGVTSLDLTGLVVRDVSASSLLSASNIMLRGADLRCSAFTGDAVAATEGADIDGLLVAATDFGVAVRTPASGSLRNTTLLGKNHTGTAVAVGPGDGLLLADIVVVNLARGVTGGAGSTLTPARLVMSGVTEAVENPDDASFVTAITSNTARVDAMLAPSTGCDDGHWPVFGSPLVDAGDPARADRDASPNDIGATGGPFGLDIVPDADDDRVSASRDCDDADPDLAPGEEDDVGNGIDEDCDGLDGVDDDGDGHASIPSGGDDCDDGEPTKFPGNPDPFGDGADTDCDGADGIDADLDGARSRVSGGDDCDDADPAVHPGAPEDDGERDLDCDGYGSPFFDTTLPTACDCDTGGGPGGAAVLLLLALVRRRR